MPCIRNLSISHALQYFDDDIKKKETKGFDYYSQEDSGVWFGKTAERLGLIDKEFTREDYHDIMKGKFSYYNKNLNKYVDIDLTKNSPNKEHHTGIELTLSAPKSISLMNEVFKDKRVLDAHLNAVNNVINYIQDNFVYTRTQINGKIQLEKVDNLLATKFTHHTNRNHDPQLHTHILIANVIIDNKGKVKTAEHSTIFENERFIRELYHNELANNLIQIGYNIEWTKKITQVAPEIKGISQELLDLFSTRRAEIEKFAEEHNLDLTNQNAMEFATLATRQAKDNSIGIDELSPVWLDKVKELGINIDEFKNSVISLENNKNNNNISLKKIIDNSILHLTERQSTFTKEELIENIMNRSNGVYNIKDIETEINKNKELIVNNKHNIEQYTKHLNICNIREKAIYTTKTQITYENIINELISNGKNKFKTISNELIKSKNYNTLNSNQKNTINFILNNKDQFIAIQGYAGVGKTYTIKVLNEELKNNNITLIGLAPTHSATDTLKNEANIETNTLQNFLLKYTGYTKYNSNDVILKSIKKEFKDKIILVDEASLISNKQMKDLLTISNLFNVRVILQGDKKQLDSVEAGSPFYRLIDNNLIKYSELTNILRQRDELIKETVYDIINKDIREAIDKLKTNNHIIEVRNDKELNKKDLDNNLYNQETKQLNKEVYNNYLNYLENNNTIKIKNDIVNKVVETYNKLDKEEKKNTLIITSSNEIRKEINNKIREEIKKDNVQNNMNNDKIINIETLEQKQLTLQEKKEIQNYNKDNIITFIKDNTKLNVKKDVEYNVIGINNNEIIIKQHNNIKDNKEIILNIEKYANNINIYNKENKELIINDKIRFITTNKEHNIIKSDSFIIKNIDNNNLTLIKENNNTEIKLNLNSELVKYIDYNYTTTTYSSQGKTSKNVIYTLESYRPILTTQKDFYVGLSRTKDNITVITDNINKSIDTLLTNTGERISAKEVENNIKIQEKEIDLDK